MILTVLAAGAASFTVAQAPPAPAPPLVLAAPSAERGVIAYPPSAFAEAAPDTAYDMVLRLPGFAFDKGAAVRGLAGSGGNVLIDGQPPVSKNDALDELLKRIPASAVARIELIRGGAPGIDMQGRSVIANVVRARASGAQGAVMASANFINDGRVLTSVRAESQAEWLGRRFEASLVYGKGPDDTLGDGPRVRFGPNGEVLIRSLVDADAGGLRAWTTGAMESPLAGGRLRVNGAYMRTPASAEITDRLSGGGREYEYFTNVRVQKELGGRYSRNLGPATTLEAVAFQQWNDVETRADFEAPGLRRDFDLDKAVTETVGRLTLRRTLSPVLSLELGGEGALNRLESRTAFTLNGRAVPLPAADVVVEETRNEVFGAVTWRARPGLTAEAGLRRETSSISSTGDVNLEKSLAFTKPRLSLAWSAGGGRQLRLRVEREVGQLNFDDFVASSSAVSTGAVLAGNPDLRPQQAWVSEAAFEQRWSNGVVLVATLRMSDLADVIDRAPIFVQGVAVADAPGNLGDGARREAVVNLTLPLDRMGLRGGQLKGQGTWRETEVVDPLTGETREISGQRPVEWEAHFTQDLPALRTNLGMDVLGGYRERYFRLSEVETRKAGIWVVAFGEYKPRRDLILRVELQNLGARNVQRIREVYVGPRSDEQLAYVDVRDLEYGRAIFVRLRKTFG
ncbi:TonB-dependent siderophore receptor [Phenylobacterium sp.]|uniref:TonB-dependent receptor plug domain-containing protein n=1 Tax=Phenylobacterium sp. TaxID=1871053 RepID=UPI00272F9BAF|nr:TonB-dependent receptor [Phenylobacterium sp.]MDP2212901.1 TonB-dependent receptor [Phenylobacterium sp.]